MPYTFFDHTGDIGVVLHGASLDELFASAALAFTETVAIASEIVPCARVSAVLDADSPDVLLVEWLGELLYRFEVRGLLPAHASVRVAPEGQRWRLRAEVEADLFDPARHHLKLLVKAVTYHELSVERTPDGWSGRVIFDI